MKTSTLIVGAIFVYAGYRFLRARQTGARIGTPSAPLPSGGVATGAGAHAESNRPSPTVIPIYGSAAGAQGGAGAGGGPGKPYTGGKGK